MQHSLEMFKEYFEYKDGFLVWKKRSGTKIKVGSTAGWLKDDGYVNIGLCGNIYFAHRIIFLLHHGYCPDIVDHINRNKSDNRIENLRGVTASQNTCNSGIRVLNKTGVKGVRITKYGKYEARLGINGKTIQVGTFNTLEAASEALNKIRQKEHGEYACNG